MKSDAGILRVGICATPGWADTNLQKNVPSLNDQIVSGHPSAGPNFIAGTSSSSTNINQNNEVLEWNTTAGETDIEKTLENIDVSSYSEVYLLVTSYTPFLALDADISTNSIDDISIVFSGSSPDLVKDGDSTTWSNYKSESSSDNTNPEIYNYDSDIYDFNVGERWSLENQAGTKHGINGHTGDLCNNIYSQDNFCYYYFIIELVFFS